LVPNRKQKHRKSKAAISSAGRLQSSSFLIRRIRRQTVWNRTLDRADTLQNLPIFYRLSTSLGRNRDKLTAEV
jgi:hypothetical protein